MVTAYAPDAVIDSFLLRHQPRFDVLSRFYHMLQEYSGDLLSNPIAVAHRFNASDLVWHGAVPLTASLLHCTDDDPAHIGQLDDSQQWTLTADNLLQNVASTLCLDASSTSLQLVTCDASNKGLLWQVNASVSHIGSSEADFPCQVPARKGEFCTHCLDHQPSQSKVTLWDCKPPSDPQQENQQFTLNAKSAHGIRSVEGDDCLTVSSANAGWAEYHEYGNVALLSNLHEDLPVTVTYRGTPYLLQNHSVVFVDIATAKVVFDTSEQVIYSPTEAQVVAVSAWSFHDELAGQGGQTTTTKGHQEQLALTDNDSDYLWYETELPSGVQSLANLQISGRSGTILYPTMVGSPTQNSSRLRILACAMGLQNGGVGPGLGKGIDGKVTIDGHDLTAQTWTQTWPLQGEADRIYTAEGVDTVTWAPVTASQASSGLVWFRASFDLPALSRTRTAPNDGVPAQVAYGLHLHTMWKGVAWVNGFDIGRYWLKPGKCSGTCAPPIKNSHCYMHWKACDQPTQSIYHIPTSILKQEGNLVVLFEESTPPKETARNVSAVSIIRLSDHPTLH